jgi:K+-sensing histidine kinase KdpD
MELATAAAEAEALANRVKTETMQALSHDLRTPLQGIMGVTSTLLLVSVLLSLVLCYIIVASMLSATAGSIEQLLQVASCILVLLLLLPCTTLAHYTEYWYKY